MTTTREILRYGSPTISGWLLSAGCFGEIDGTQVPLTLGFHSQLPVGFATIHETSDGVTAQFEIPDRLLVDKETSVPFEMGASYACRKFHRSEQSTKLGVLEEGSLNEAIIILPDDAK